MGLRSERLTFSAHKTGKPTKKRTITYININYLSWAGHFDSLDVGHFVATSFLYRFHSGFIVISALKNFHYFALTSGEIRFHKNSSLFSEMASLLLESLATTTL